MTRFNWLKGLLDGIAIWLLLFGVVASLTTLNLYGEFLMQVPLVLFAGLLSYAFVHNVTVTKYSQAFSYGLLWAGISLALDFSVTAQQINRQLLTQWPVWASYLLIAVAPMLQVVGAGRHIHYSETEALEQ